MSGLANLKKATKDIEGLYNKIEKASADEVNTLVYEMNKIINAIPYYTTQIYQEANKEATTRRSKLIEESNKETKKQIKELDKPTPKKVKAKKVVEEKVEEQKGEPESEEQSN